MINRLLKISSAVIVFVLLFTFHFSATSAAESFGPKLLQPQLSSDGKTLYDATPFVVYMADPNPPPQQARIPAPAYLLAQPEMATATFSITYVANGGNLSGASCTTFPDGAKTALNAAAAVWGNLLQSPVPITIIACWSSSLPSGALAGTGGQPLHRGFTGAPLPNTWYEGSLANALHGSDLDPSHSDMQMAFSSTISWYYGTDGATPSGHWDFMSVALHEITHGLNFSGSMDVASGLGSWGISGFPIIYDTFMKDAATGGNVLISDPTDYPNPSTALGTVLTSGSSPGVWFDGTNANAANGGNRVQIYTPSTWSDGSSYSHLDYNTFKNTINRLMVYAIGSGVSTHDPGPVVLGMLQDMGWPILVTTDVTIAMVDSPHTLMLGNNLTYTITVSKYGPGAATSVNVTDVLPAGLTYVSATPSQGSCSGTSTVTCDLGTINNGNSATIILVVTPIVNGIFNNTATLTSSPSPTTDHADTSTTVNNPVPAISSLSPTWTPPGGADFTLTVNGSNFVSNSKIQWNSANIPNATNFVSSTQLTVTIPLSDIATAGTANVTVVNPAPGGGTTSALTFTISTTAPAPPAGGGGGGGCFIATAAFGSPLEKHVQILRDFRDRVLLNSPLGKALVTFYYEVSPPIAQTIAQNEGLRFITRVMLMPVIGVAYLILQMGMFMTVLFFAVILFMVIFTIRILRKRITKAAA